MEGKPAYWREPVHSMLRRCIGWDYSQPCIYMITVVLADRESRALGNVLVDNIDEYGTPVAAHCEASPLGRAVADCWENIPKFYPQIKIISSCVMPDHFHGILWVKEPLKCHLGQVIKGFKIGCNRSWGIFVLADNIGENRTRPLFALGFQDTILFREGQLAAMIKYLKDNPLRLAVKRAKPKLFTLRRNVAIPLEDGAVGHFNAVGNLSLIERPLVQVQCSRSWFAYRRVPKLGGGYKIARDADGAPVVEKITDDYTSRRDALFAAASHGIGLISPCVSDGEREIAREALAAGMPLVTMHNKGFSPIQKPSGRYFDACSEGKLLMLSPIRWPYVPGEKVMTRIDALIMNRLCQHIARDGAAEINYRGMNPRNIDDLARNACSLV